jgi:hypothetical protein
MSPGGSWTEERINTACAMWAAGSSAGEIAKTLDCGLSRNAVIGKIHRLGLAGRAVAASPTANSAYKGRLLVSPERKKASDEARAAVQRIRNHPQRGAGRLPPLVEASDHPGKVLADLGPGECRAPRRDSDPGPGRMDTMLYCAATPEPDQHYCVACQGWMAPRKLSPAEQARFSRVRDTFPVDAPVDGTVSVQADPLCQAILFT